MPASRQVPPLVHIKLVYVHGFLGSVETFKDLPSHLGTLLHQRYPNTRVDNNLYLYKTRGTYHDAPSNLCNAIMHLTETRWINDPNSLIILIGHSMGGLVAADAIRMIYDCDESPFPNGAKVIGLLAYDTPYFSIDRDFIMAGIKTMATAPLSSAYHLYATKNVNKQSQEEKSTRRRIGERIAARVVKRLNFVVTELINVAGELVVCPFIAAAVLMCAFAFYVYKELDYDAYEVYPEMDDDLENCIVLPGSSSNNATYREKVRNYLKFSLENFRSEHTQDARIRDLVENPNIQFKCIYNTVPILPGVSRHRSHSQFIRTDSSELCDRKYFQALSWPVDPFGNTRPKHYRGGAESVLAHIQMFGTAQTTSAHQTLGRLHDMSMHFLTQVIESHSQKYQYPQVY